MLELCRMDSNQMNREELQAEIKRVYIAIRKTDSPKLRHDYGKYLRRLNRELNYYDRAMGMRKAGNKAV